MKTLKKLTLTLAISISLFGCAGTRVQDNLVVSHLTGFTEPTIALATYTNPKTGDITQQLFTAPGMFTQVFQGAVQAGASYLTYGMYKSNNNNNLSVSGSNNKTTTTKTINPVTGSGTGSTAIYNNLSAIGGKGGEAVTSNNMYQTGGNTDITTVLNQQVTSSSVSEGSSAIATPVQNIVNNPNQIIAPEISFSATPTTENINNNNCNGRNCGIENEGNGDN
jgi:hypothetical protein